MNKVPVSYWASIDIGVTAIRLMVARCRDREKYEIVVTYSRLPSGVRKGMIVNEGATVRAIADVVAQMRTLHGIAVTRAVVGLSGNQVVFEYVKGLVSISGREVAQVDLQQAQQIAQTAITHQRDREILSIQPVYFTIDGGKRMRNVLGSSGMHLEAVMQVTRAFTPTVRQVRSCCEAAGVRAEVIVLEQAALARAALSSIEQEMGVSILDVGGDESRLVRYQYGRLCSLQIIPIGGNHFTHDLAICLRISPESALSVKHAYSLSHEGVKDLLYTEANGTTRTIARADIHAILQPRLEEFCMYVHEQVQQDDRITRMPYGLVLAGRGSLLFGMRVSLERVLSVPVRRGDMVSMHHQDYLFSNMDEPQRMGCMTAYGLLLHAIDQPNSMVSKRGCSRVYDLLEQVKSWFVEAEQ